MELTVEGRTTRGNDLLKSELRIRRKNLNVVKRIKTVVGHFILFFLSIWINEHVFTDSFFKLRLE